MEETKEVPWKYNGKVVTEADVPENCVGFIYRITMFPTADMRIWIENGHLGMKRENATRKEYIGKKQLTTNRKGKITKKEIRETGTRKRVKRVVKNSGWLSYNSSCKPLQEHIAMYPELYTKEILHWCFSKKNMSLMEMVEQVRHEVLWKDSWNDHISHFYRHDTDATLYQQHMQRMKEKRQNKQQ